jgi:hypothetical protein
MPQRRTAAKLIRFAPDELAAVSRRARTCGRTPARFIREAALGAIPKVRHNEDRDRALVILARLGGQLSVPARRTNGDDQAVDEEPYDDERDDDPDESDDVAIEESCAHRATGK